MLALDDRLSEPWFDTEWFLTCFVRTDIYIYIYIYILQAACYDHFGSRTFS
jgi:hypothetical protein